MKIHNVSQSMNYTKDGYPFLFIRNVLGPAWSSPFAFFFFNCLPLAIRTSLLDLNSSARTRLYPYSWLERYRSKLGFFLSLLGFPVHILLHSFFFTVRKNDLKYWFNWLGGISWISRWSLCKGDFIHRLNTSRSALAFCFVFFGTCASTKSLISSSFRIFRFVLFSRRQKSTSYFP